MRIALLLPGSGSQIYCENCVRDGSLANGLKARGHEVTICPLYLPLPHTPDEKKEGAPIFYGAVNLYVKQRLPFFKRAPGWIANLLDSPPALKLAGAFSGSTNSTGLEELTISMLEGERGDQRLELEKLVEWLELVRPDVVHLSNGLLIGLARRIGEALRVPVVCSLQDEDGWINAMRYPFADQVWALMARRAADVDLFLPVSEWYAGRMKELLQLDHGKMKTVPIGMEFDTSPPAPLGFTPPVIGYLAPLTKEMGVELLIDAFLLLRRRAGFSRATLYLSGGIPGKGSRLGSRMVRKLRSGGAIGDVTVVPVRGNRQRADFLSSLTVLSVPVLGGEAFGAFQLEAMAAGVPVVQPALGGFSEIIDATGGGVTYAPNSPVVLAETLSALLGDPPRVRSLAAAGRGRVRKEYTLSRMIDNIEDAYRGSVRMFGDRGTKA